MWKDRVEKRFFWARMKRELEKTLYELVKAEQEEDTGIYLLLMHYDHAAEELSFAPEEKKKILSLLKRLIEDTRRHQKLLQEMIEKLEREKAHEKGE